MRHVLWFFVGGSAFPWEVAAKSARWLPRRSRGENPAPWEWVVLLGESPVSVLGPPPWGPSREYTAPAFPPSLPRGGASRRDHAVSLAVAWHVRADGEWTSQSGQDLSPTSVAYCACDLGQAAGVWPSRVRRRVSIPNHNTIAMKLHVNKVTYTKCQINLEAFRERF